MTDVISQAVISPLGLRALLRERLYFTTKNVGPPKVPPGATAPVALPLPACVRY